MAVTTLRVSRLRLTRQERHDVRNGLLFAAPGIVGFLLFYAYPILASVYYSFTSYSILQPGHWVGLDNYRELLTEDPIFYTALTNTIYMAVVTIPLSIVLAMALAMLLNLKVRGQAFYRTIFYLPTIVPFVASSLLWLWIFNPQYGLINTLLWYVGIQGPGWLGDPNWSKPALVIMLLWGVGNWMIIYLAGLQDVPQELYEGPRSTAHAGGPRPGI